MDLRPTLSTTLKRASAVIEAHRMRTSEGVAVMWQGLREGANTLEIRVSTARSRLPSGRLLVVVCKPGKVAPQAGVCPIEIPVKHFRVLHPATHARFKVLKGGRGSAKSWSIARVLIALAL